ncbi:MAG: hypothetical protein AAFY54_16000, partial [Cyanobacteria bacterium J06648_10]
MTQPTVNTASADNSVHATDANATHTSNASDSSKSSSSKNDRTENDRVLIFDTTLRDGEQSPGATMNVAEKLAVARQLARLKVDIIEAGFPFASPGDFEAVHTIANEVGIPGGPTICGLARAT